MTTARKAAWHLIAGPTGAGKSTCARALEAPGTSGKSDSAVRFAIDEWMSTLFWPDCPEKNNLPWALERVSRCEAQITVIAAALAHTGVASVLDLGFSQQAQRQAWVERARLAGVPLVLHVLDAPAELRWQRVVGRNAGKSETFTFQVTRAMFDQMETFWESPTAGERALYAEVITEDSLVD